MKTIKETLIESARDEFFKKGYDKASLRVICANANVTTGALYSSFNNKEDLLRAVLEDTINESFQYVDRVISDQFECESSVSVSELISFLQGRRKEFHILFYGCSKTAYEKYRDTLLDKAAEIFSHNFRKNSISIDERLVRLLAKKSIDSYIDLVGMDYPKQETVILARAMNLYTKAGLAALIRQFS